MTTKNVLRIFLLIVVAIALGFARTWHLEQYLTMDFLQANHERLKDLVEAHFNIYALYFFVFYVLVTALSFPGAALLTLAAGAIFGVWPGIAIVSVAATLGATLSFLGARFLFRDLVREKFSHRLKDIEVRLQKEGGFHLFTLRTIPLFPFYLVNLLMGLTSFPVLKYIGISFIGMLPGTFAYLFAGERIAEIRHLSDVMSPPVLGALTLLGLLPWIGKLTVEGLRRRRINGPFQRPRRFDYNLVAIGAGAAGLVTSSLAALARAKVALVENGRMGGDCLNTGCVPSKALIHIARKRQLLREAGASDREPDFAKVMNEVRAAIRRVEPHDSVERYRNLGVDCFQGEAHIKTPWEIVVDGRLITTRNIVVATGSEPRVPDIPGLQEAGFKTSETLWDLNALPGRLVVLGGGVMGCELAQALARLGSQVTLVERSDRLLHREDPEASTLLEAKFKKEGIKVLTSSSAIKIRSENGKKVLDYEEAGDPPRKGSILFDEILIALGRQARVKNFGLEKLDVELREDGTIATDPYLRTQYPNIYACGDVTGPYQMTHAASHQAWYCAVNSLFGCFVKFKVRYEAIPSVVYCDPEIARVGLSEQEARAKGLPFKTYRFEMSDLDRALIDGATEGFAKALVEPGTDRLLGVTLVGTRAGDLLAEWTLAIKNRLGLKAVLTTLHPYPTYSEVNRHLAGVWRKATAPKKLLNWAERYHRWLRRA